MVLMRTTKEIELKLQKKDKPLYDLFDQLLPLYWKKENEVPTKIRLILCINKWINCVHACNDIAYHMLESIKYQKEAQKKLTHEISIHEHFDAHERRVIVHNIISENNSKQLSLF